MSADNFQRRADDVARRLCAKYGAIEECTAETRLVTVYHFESGHRVEFTMRGNKLVHEVLEPEAD